MCGGDDAGLSHCGSPFELRLKKQDRGTPPLYRNKYSTSLK